MINETKCMDTTFERKQNSIEWYTPKYIIDALNDAGGFFDIDPCAPIKPPFEIAPTTYNIETDGLAHTWKGHVWLNPPYKHPIVDRFIDKMVLHNDGIALLFDRCDQSMWQDKIFPSASALLFMRGRIKFLKPDGTSLQGAGCGSVLIAWGDWAADVLKNSNIDGYYIRL